MKNKKYYISYVLYIFLVQFDLVSSLLGFRSSIFLSIFLYMFWVKNSLIKNRILAMFFGFVLDFSYNSSFIGLSSIIFLMYLHLYQSKRGFLGNFIIDCVFYFFILLNILFSSVSLNIILYVFIFNLILKLTFSNKK